MQRRRAHGCAGSLDALLAGQLRYYRERAPEYLRTSFGPVPEQTFDRLLTELERACDAHVRGHVLELACGPGTWTEMLARRAEHVTAVDGAPEMLELAGSARLGDNVSFERADIFDWRPARRYDAVFFGFWISHVPDQRFASFWELVGGALAPGGSVLFVDDAYRTEDELVFGAGSGVIERVLENGSHHQIVKVPNTPAGLHDRLAQLGWAFELHDLAPFFWGVGRPA